MSELVVHVASNCCSVLGWEPACLPTAERLRLRCSQLAHLSWGDRMFFSNCELLLISWIYNVHHRGSYTNGRPMFNFAEICKEISVFGWEKVAENWGSKTGDPTKKWLNLNDFFPAWWVAMSSWLTDFPWINLREEVGATPHKVAMRKQWATLVHLSLWDQ